MVMVPVFYARLSKTMEQDDRQGCSLFLLSLEECDTTEAVHPQGVAIFNARSSYRPPQYTV